MKSQGKGWLALDLRVDRSEACFDRWRSLRKPGRLFQTLAFWLLCNLLGWTNLVQAQSTNYVYDANGRVVAVTASNGTSVQYSYDTLGHASQISAPLPSGQLAIFAFTPIHGVAGTEVTLQGQGFSSAATNDSVSFNGTVATVLSATANQLVAAVPSGATTGLISVTAGSQAATSSTSFVIDDSGTPPTITGVSPVIVAAGEVVTVTGTHLDPLPGETNVVMGDQQILALQSISDAQLTFTVPASATSGYLVVETPYGQAASALPIAVLPAGISANTVGSTGNLAVNGAPASINNGSAGQIAVMTFTAGQNPNLELTLNGVAITGSSATSVAVTVYNPSGSSIANETCNTTNPNGSCRLSLWNLAPGTYSVVVSPPDANSVMSFNALVEADVQGPATTMNTPMAISLGTGEVERLTFNATAGGSISLNLSGVTTMAGEQLYVNVYAPGSNLANFITRLNPSTTLNLTNLPSTGTYTLLVYTLYGTPGSAQLAVGAPVIQTLTSSGIAQSLTSSINGQYVYLNFSANQGDNLELTLNNLASPGGASNSATVTVDNATGTVIGSETCATSNPNGSCRISLWNLAAGTYTAVVQPTNGNTTISFNALLEPDVVGPVMVAGSPQAVNLAAGQVERLTFNANAGDSATLNLSNVSVMVGEQLYVNVYAPGTNLATFITRLNPGITLNLTNLPSTGAYTLLVYTLYGTSGSAQLTMASPPTAELIANGTAQNYAANVEGQNVYLSFNANQGDNLELALDNMAISGSSATSLSVNVYNASGTYVGGPSCSTVNPGDSCRLSLWNMAAGAYSVVVSPPDNASLVSFDATLESDAQGPSVALNTPVAIAVPEGNVERLMCSVPLGTAAVLSMSSVSASQGDSLYVNVYSQSGTNQTANYIGRLDSSDPVNLPSQSVNATYTLVAYTLYGNPGSAQMTCSAQ